MLIGVGIDLAAADFWAKALVDPATAVVEGTFTAQELESARARSGPLEESLAARFAAKEAFVKALGGTRVSAPPLRTRVEPREVEVCSDDYGRPYLVLHGDAKSLADELGVRHAWLSLTHEAGQAAAVVVLEG